MTMPPVRAEDNIRWPQMGGNAGCDRLFADIRMAGTMDQASLVTASQFLLGLSNRLHDTIKRLNDITGRESYVGCWHYNFLRLLEAGCMKSIPLR